MESFTNLLFIDIETVPKVKDFAQLDDRTKELFVKKFHHKLDEIKPNYEFYESTNMIVSDNSVASKLKLLWQQNASLHAEFSRIACVSLGLLSVHPESDDELGGHLNLKLHSIISRNENTVLTELATVLNKIPNHSLVGHNIKDFDVPYATRRYYANKIKLPSILNIGSKKPWEISWKDTLEMWAAGQWKYKVSLDLLCNTFGIESPKQELDGSKVAEVFYYETSGDELPFDKETEAFKKITDYCENDIIACAKCYLEMIGSDKKIVSTSH